MNDTKDTSGKGRTLGLRMGGTETSQVRQSFSHGRSKAVTVEVKRRRPLVGKPGQPASSEAATRLNVTDAEVERRMRALEQARASENERIARERAAEEARRSEMEKLRREKEEAERAEREREIAQQRREQEEQERAAAAQARPKERDDAARPRPAPAAGRPAPRPGEATPAPRTDAARPDAARPGLRRVADRVEEERKPVKAKADADKRRSGKLTIANATDDDIRQRSMAAIRRRQERDKRRMAGANEPREKVVREVAVPDAITVGELANRMAERVAAVVKALMQNGIFATQNQTIDADTAQLVVEEFGHRPVRVSESDVEDAIDTVKDSDDNLLPRAPVVTIMGHVDHGKTSLLDAIRKTSVVAGEAGGITQHIGAYQVQTPNGGLITFIDTPGHAAFTSMRARGAQVTDIVILVVAADDSVMPQTVEAINHAKAAGVPMIVAINKIDKPSADPQKVRTGLLQHEVVVEQMGGEVLDVEVSAVTRQGLDSLLDNIVLQAEILDLKANPNRAAEAAVIEAQLDVGRGPVATVLVQNGTLRQGDIFVVGQQWGKVRALINSSGERVAEAGPSLPVEVLGLNGAPEAGDTLNVVETEAKAREIASYRERLAREKKAAQGASATLDQLLAKAKADASVKELPIVVKADVQGSAEAIVQAMEKVGNDEVRVRVLHSGVGAITDSDVTLAEASKAPIIGFNVRANASARESASQKGIEIRYYSIIYDLVDDIKQAASGLLSDEVKEKFIGYATIKQVFKVTGAGKVAGCLVTDGVARRSAGVRLLRDNVVVHQGKLKTLKRFKDEVKEVQSGQECGMAFENYDDIREGDVIEIFETETVERTLA
jgi:translation initiation factor IF-2